MDRATKFQRSCWQKSANSEIDALVVLKNSPMDLIILDVMMPRLDGFSVCKMARKMSDMPVVMLTAREDGDDKLKGYDYGADDYMTKPFSPRVYSGSGLGLSIVAALIISVPFKVRFMRRISKSSTV